MPTIYELSKLQQELQDALFFDEDNEGLHKKLVTVFQQEGRKFDYLMTLLAELIAHEEAAKMALNKQKERFDRSVKAKERLKDFIFKAMEFCDIEKYEGLDLSVRIQNNPPAVKIDEWVTVDNVPQDCIKTIPEKKEIMKTELKKHLSNGEEIPGVILEQSQSLRVY